MDCILTFDSGESITIATPAIRGAVQRAAMKASELPSTLKDSPPEAKRAFMKTYKSAVRDWTSGRDGALERT
jgi:hypothetical protein